MFKLLLCLHLIIAVTRGHEYTEPAELTLIDPEQFENDFYNFDSSGNIPSTSRLNKYLYDTVKPTEANEAEVNNKTNKPSTPLLIIVQQNETFNSDIEKETDDRLNNSEKLLSQREISNEKKALQLLEQFPSKIVIHYENNRLYGKEYIYDHCGGVLISDERILTSSICFGYFKNDSEPEFILSKDKTIHFKISLFANSYQFDGLTRFLDIISIIIKPSFGLAVLRIDPLNISKTVNRGLLPNMELSTKDNVTVLQLPHYLDEKNDGQIELLKRGIISIIPSGNFKVFENSNVSDFYFGSYQSRADGFCNIWQGDPVYNSERDIVGIVQFPGGCTYGDFSNNSYLVITNIYKHVQWIHDTLMYSTDLSNELKSTFKR